MLSDEVSVYCSPNPLPLGCPFALLSRLDRRRPHTVLFFKIYAVEIGHQFRARGIIRIGQDYISSEYEQVPMGRF